MLLEAFLRLYYNGEYKPNIGNKTMAVINTELQTVIRILDLLKNYTPEPGERELGLWIYENDFRFGFAGSPRVANINFEEMRYVQFDLFELKGSLGYTYSHTIELTYKPDDTELKHFIYQAFDYLKGFK